jgi:hypothetical protein
MANVRIEINLDFVDQLQANVSCTYRSIVFGHIGIVETATTNFFLVIVSLRQNIFNFKSVENYSLISKSWRNDLAYGIPYVTKFHIIWFHLKQNSYDQIRFFVKLSKLVLFFRYLTIFAGSLWRHIAWLSEKNVKILGYRNCKTVYICDVNILQIYVICREIWIDYL